LSLLDIGNVKELPRSLNNMGILGGTQRVKVQGRRCYTTICSFKYRKKAAVHKMREKNLCMMCVLYCAQCLIMFYVAILDEFSSIITSRQYLNLWQVSSICVTIYISRL